MLTHNGLVVPYITRWSHESDRSPFQIAYTKTGTQFARYQPEYPEDRDQRGILWGRENHTRSGHPEYAQVHGHRQRKAMRIPLCQVCGERLGDPPYHFVINTALYKPVEILVTPVPPVCEQCAPIATSLCPNLKTKGYVHLLVGKVEPYGVMGDVAWYDDNRKLYHDKEVELAYGDPRLLLMVAKQALVTLSEIHVVGG